ncbi:hypothetical protein F4778DRAFT_767607 [Xylariomycetidae sp. FL2044]|nr:hypothetical protein F4778DRAFT_767607 [Xylariomycetidae sp. FL2044]
MCNSLTKACETCGRVSKQRIACRDFTKQQDQAKKSFFGRFFHRDVKRKDCGKIIPYSVGVATCEKCTLGSGRLRVHPVGNGAMRVQLSTFEDEFRAQRKQAARESLKKAERHALYKMKKQHHNHEIVDAKPSVWLPNLYHHPETMARKETYGRPPAVAPRIDPTRPSKSRSGQGPSREGQLKAAGVLSLSATRTPVFGDSKPLLKPVIPAPVHVAPSSRVHVMPTPVVSVVPPPTKRELLRKKGKVHRTIPPRLPPTPLPEWQIYLNAMKLAEKNAPTESEKVAAMMKFSPERRARPGEPPCRYVIEEKEPAFRQFGKSFGIVPSSPMSDTGSDVSFFCADSKRIAAQLSVRYGR